MSTEETTLKGIEAQALHTLAETMKLHTQQQREMTDHLKEMIDKHEEHLKQFRVATELMEQFVSEQDRLTGRVSTQLKAQIQLVEEMKRIKQVLD